MDRDSSFPGGKYDTPNGCCCGRRPPRTTTVVLTSRVVRRRTSTKSLRFRKTTTIFSGPRIRRGYEIELHRDAVEPAPEIEETEVSEPFNETQFADSDHQGNQGPIIEEKPSLLLHFELRQARHLCPRCPSFAKALPNKGTLKPASYRACCPGPKVKTIKKVVVRTSTRRIVKIVKITRTVTRTRAVSDGNRLWRSDDTDLKCFFKQALQTITGRLYSGFGLQQETFCFV